MDLFSENTESDTDWPVIPVQFHSPTYDFEWFAACADAFYDYSVRCPITIDHDNQLSAVAPLFKLKKKGLTWQEIMGVSRLHEPGGLVYSDGRSLDALCQSIVKRGRPTLLGRLHSEDPVIETFEKTAHKRGILLKVRNTGSPYIEISSGWDDYFQLLSSRRRQDYRRARRRLSDHGEVSVTFSLPNQGNVDQLLEEVFRVEQASWKGRNNTAINCRPEMKQFFKTYARSVCTNQQIVISSLQLNGESIAVQLLVEHAKRWWILKIGYDDEWKKYSPGMQLMFDTLKEAFDRKLDAIELLGTEEQWISIWPHKTHEFFSLVYFPFTFSGITALIMEGGEKVLSKLQRKLA
ncbi:MAG: GNAT family N-acetyltransferase [Candidatus Thiodiazotropha sp.]